MTASFSSPNGSVFSVQSDATTYWTMKQFSGNYLYDNNLNVNPALAAGDQARHVGGCDIDDSRIHR